jgi:hypothetical protein
VGAMTTRERPEPRSERGRAATRVVDAQRQAGTTLRLTLAFTVAAPTTAPAGGSTWLSLHLFLVGGVLTAIAAATQLLAVTWSASPAPPDRLVAAQRWALAGGAVAVAAGREAGLDPVAGAGGASVGVGIALLAASLASIRRSGRNDRFRPAIDGYLAALACAGAGVGLGVWLALTEPSLAWLDVRSAHVTLNLFGLVVVVIAATLPAFVATQARTKMHPRATPRNQRAVLGVLVAAVLVTAGAQLAGDARVAATGRVGIVAGLVGVATLLPRIGRRQLRWAGPRLVQLTAGLAWLIGATTALVASDLDGRAAPLGLLAALAVGGVAQILVASLAYLAPVLRAGGHERLTAGFAATRSWTSLAAGNVAAILLVVGAHGPALALLAAWAAELVVRAAQLARPGSAVPIREDGT